MESAQARLPGSFASLWAGNLCEESQQHKKDVGREQEQEATHVGPSCLLGSVNKQELFDAADVMRSFCH